MISISFRACDLSIKPVQSWKSLRKSWNMLLAIFCLMVTSCSTSHMKYIGDDNWVSSMSKSPLINGEMSYRSKYFLVQNALIGQFNEDPRKALETIASDIENTGIAAGKPGLYGDTLPVLIELCAYQAHQSSGKEAIKYWMSTCFYSFKYLYDKSCSYKLTPYTSIDYAASIRLYNYSLSKIFKYCVDNKISFESSPEFDLIKGKVRFTAMKSDLIWPEKEFEDYVDSYDYMPKNLQVHSYVAGIGVPILGLRELDIQANRIKEPEMVNRAYQFTFLIDFHSFNPEKGTIDATPEFMDSYNNESVMIRGEEVPLSKDYSIAIAKSVDSYHRISGIEYMFNPDKMGILQGIYMGAPYDPDKIPVVLVHGLMSDPDTWMEMINTLLGNKTIRENYQFWLYAYPTGQPVYYSAEQFREDLQAVYNRYNPLGSNKKFNKMIIIGHSMGGLLTKLSIQSTDDKAFLEKFINMKIDSLELTPEQKKFLIDMMVFKALPFVKCVIFIATPHKGSELAVFSLSRLGSSLISLPSTIKDNTRDIMSQIYEVSGIKEKDVKIPTGIDTLAPNNKFLDQSYALPISKDVEMHSIIGDKDEANHKFGSDGVVAYSSSHMDNVTSELVVKSGHSVHQTPEAIKEVQRILLEYLVKTGELHAKTENKRMEVSY